MWMTPVLPFINDTEANLRGLLDYCFDAGVVGVLSFGIGVTLRDGDREYFYAALDRYFPGIKRKYIAAFGNSYVCASPSERKLYEILDAECDARGVLRDSDKIFEFLNTLPEPPAAEQLRLF